MRYFNAKKGLTDLVLLEITWSGKEHGLMKFPKSWTDEKRAIGPFSKKLKVLYIFGKVKHSDLVLMCVTWRG